MEYLFQYDSVHGEFRGNVKHGELNGNPILTIDGRQIKVFSYKDPAQIPWGKIGVEYVAETSGAFTTSEKASTHLAGGAKRVIISAPPKDKDIPIFVYGVNHTKFDPNTMTIVSNASCTTNCLAPLAKLVHDKYEIIEGMMTTIHAGTFL